MDPRDRNPNPTETMDTAENLEQRKLLIEAIERREEQAALEFAEFEPEEYQHTHLQCRHFLCYLIHSDPVNSKGYSKIMEAEPDYSLLGEFDPSVGFDSMHPGGDSLKLAALQYAFACIEHLQAEIAFADRTGQAWRNSAILRLLDLA